jgi:hypothetical protein
MTKPITDPPTGPIGPIQSVSATDETELVSESPPGTPLWVKVFGILLIVVMLAFAGLHLTGNAPTHMSGSSGAEHGIQLP